MSENHPAFPTNANADTLGICTIDYFAAKALTGLCANPNVSFFLEEDKDGNPLPDQKPVWTAQEFAELAAEIGHEMCIALGYEKRNPSD